MRPRASVSTTRRHRGICCSLEGGAPAGVTIPNNPTSPAMSATARTTDVQRKNRTALSDIQVVRVQSGQRTRTWNHFPFRLFGVPRQYPHLNMMIMSWP
jgi:hypothetical protein